MVAGASVVDVVGTPVVDVVVYGTGVVVVVLNVVVEVSKVEVLDSLECLTSHEQTILSIY